MLILTCCASFEQCLCLGQPKASSGPGYKHYFISEYKLRQSPLCAQVNGWNILVFRVPFFGWWTARTPCWSLRLDPNRRIVELVVD